MLGDMGADESMVDETGVVRIGSVVFALIRPSPGHEIAFNRWYERDHYYTAGLAAPGVFSAGRFVQPESGWHLALYFVLPGHDEARVEFATAQVALAAAEDRLFGEREHLHTWTYDLGSVDLGDDGVPLALALDHRYPEITVEMFDGDVPGVEGPALTLRPRVRVMPSTWDADIDPARSRTVVRFGPQSTVSETAVWSARFVPVTFGTDSHAGA